MVLSNIITAGLQLFLGSASIIAMLSNSLLIGLGFMYAFVLFNVYISKKSQVIHNK
ncbi:hypothetical protein Metlim_0283 [Methanoplanus limicola DSM 2279]|uniref:Uncharacterized protein n=1 Tax=Methanoplanus limicola DSM 2279 TaxID=937775 RepID=H1Z0F8_9EURY|nr:hypothetical protein Metlim_0283 [Methanoplanus limicola DSM 2279]